MTVLFTRVLFVLRRCLFKLRYHIPACSNASQDESFQAQGFKHRVSSTEFSVTQIVCPRGGAALNRRERHVVQSFVRLTGHVVLTESGSYHDAKTTCGG